MPGGISLLHICITYMKIMMCDSWNIRCDSSPSPLTYWKIKSLKPWRYYHFTNVYHKWQSYDVWLLRYGAQQTKIMTICYTVPEKRHVTDVIFISHSGLFFVLLPLPPSLMTQKIKILKKRKKKKKHLEILLFYRCVQMKIMIYGSWDIERNRHFLPFDRPNKLKNQNFEKIKKQNEKKIWRYYHFAIVYHKWHHMMMYADNFLTFCAIFLPYYTTNNPEK